MMVSAWKVALCGLFVSLVGFGSRTAWAADPIEVLNVAEATIPTVRLTPKSGSGLMVPACRGVVWQRFDARTNDYVPISDRPCSSMSPGLPVTPDGRTFEVDAPVQDGDVVRAVVVVGSGCTTGKPFELASCKTVVAVEGSTITVRGSGG
jgi:hypothetical protein